MDVEKHKGDDESVPLQARIHSSHVTAEKDCANLLPVEEDLLEKLKMIAFESVARPGPVREREMMGHVSPVIRCEEPAVSPIDRRRYDLLLVSQGRQGFCC